MRMLSWFGWLFILIICSILAFIIVVYHILDLRHSADIVTTFVRYFLSKHFRTFRIRKMSFFPLHMEGVEIVMKATRKQPEMQISFKWFKLVVDRKRLSDPFISVFRAWFGYFYRKDNGSKGSEFYCYSPMISLEFDHFFVSSPNAEFKHFLESSAAAKVISTSVSAAGNKSGKANSASTPPTVPPGVDQQIEISKLQQSFLMRMIMSFALHFVGMFEMKMTNMSFDMNLDVHECAIQGSCDKMHILGKRSQLLGTEGFTVINVIHGGIMEILDAGDGETNPGATSSKSRVMNKGSDKKKEKEKQRALMYVGRGARFAIDFVAANGHMDVMVNLYGREDDLEIRVQPFLSFYHKYQRAEDNAVELKLAKGLPTASKMAMGVEFEYMKVGIYDCRMVNSLLVIEVEKVSACLMSFRMTTDGRRTHKNKLCLETNISSSNDSGRNNSTNVHEEDQNGKIGIVLRVPVWL